MTTTAENTTAAYIADSLRTVIRLGEALVKDIPANAFATSPHPTMNHPAFCLGHLATYPDKVLTLIGRADRVGEKDGWNDLFSHTVKCINDPNRYPAKDEIVAHFLERHQTALDALLETEDEVFRGEHPAEGRFKEMFPTIGGVVNFMMGGHAMFHLGQVSAWRRAVGLPPVM